MSSRSDDITTSPKIALPMLIRDERTIDNNLLNLSNSYNRTVFIDSSYVIGCLFCAYSISKFFGNFSKIPLHASESTSSCVLPAAPATLGYIVNAVANIDLVTLMAEVISALLCIPNTSVRSLIGTFSSINEM